MDWKKMSGQLFELVVQNPILLSDILDVIGGGLEEAIVEMRKRRLPADLIEAWGDVLEVYEDSRHDIDRATSAVSG